MAYLIVVGRNQMLLPYNINRRSVLLGTAAALYPVKLQSAPNQSSRLGLFQRPNEDPTLILAQDDRNSRDDKLNRDNEKWKTLLKDFLDQYSVFMDQEPISTLFGLGTKQAHTYSPGMFTLEVNNRVRRIDAGFTYHKVSPPAFNHFRVETLMNQVADLLDRCLAIKREWEENSTKSPNLFIDVIKFVRDQMIQDDEIANGLFTTPYSSSTANSESNAKEIGHLRNATPSLELLRAAYGDPPGNFGGGGQASNFKFAVCRMDPIRRC
jgi:hypothetical protein